MDDTGSNIDRLEFDGVIAELRELACRLTELEERITALEAAKRATEPPIKDTEVSEQLPPRVARHSDQDLDKSPPELEPKPEPESQPEPRFEPPEKTIQKKPSIFNPVIQFFYSGNPLNKIGALTLLVGAGAFFKYAVDTNLIGPTGRVVLGIFSGLALMGFGEHCQKKNWTSVAAGFIGAGAGVIFISIYVAQHSYSLLSAGPAFFIDLLLTTVIFAQALRYNSQAIGVMGLLSGFLTPILASSGSGDFVSLSIYLLLLNSAVLGIAYYRKWNALKWMAFTFTEFYLLAWVLKYDQSGLKRNRHYSLSLEWIIPFVSIFFLYFTLIPTYRSLAKKEAFGFSDIYLTVTNGVVSFGLLYLLLSSTQRPYLGLVAAIVAAVYLFICAKVVSFETADRRMYKTMLGVGAWYLFAAVPMIVSGHYITIAWCIEAVIIAWFSTKDRYQFFFPHVVSVLVLIGLRLIFWDQLFEIPRYSSSMNYFPFADSTTLTGLVAAVSFYLIVRITENCKLWQAKYPWIFAAAVATLTLVAYREAHSVSHLFLASTLPGYLADRIAFSLWGALCAGILILAISKTSETSRLCVFLYIAAALLLLNTITSFWDQAYYLNRLSIGQLQRLSLLEHLGVALLFALIALGVYVYRRMTMVSQHAEESSYGSWIPWFILAGVIGITIVIIRRELHALIFLPPLSQHIARASQESVYQMALSCAYSIVAFLLYLRGVSRQQKGLVYTAYALFAFTGVKVYLFDLATASQIYRVLSLIVFGLLLLVSDFVKQRLTEKHLQNGDA